MSKEEQVAINIFEAGANALYQTIDPNDGSCSNPKKYEELKLQAIDYIKPLLDEIAELKENYKYYVDKCFMLEDKLKSTQSEETNVESQEDILVDLLYLRNAKKISYNDILKQFTITRNI